MPPNRNFNVNERKIRGAFHVIIVKDFNWQQFVARLQKSPNQHPNTPETQRLQAEIHALKQRLQETGARGDNELEQWRKVVEQEKNRADQAEKAATEMHKHVQVILKALTRQ